MSKYAGWIMLVISLALVISGCARKESPDKETSAAVENAKITFLELGSVTCIPCKKMQPIMKSIERRYGGQVKVIFHDVMKDKAISQQYGIKLIPTQIFLDPKGTELLRHQGFFPEEEIDKFLASQGLIPSYGLGTLP